MSKVTTTGVGTLTVQGFLGSDVENKGEYWTGSIGVQAKRDKEKAVQWISISSNEMAVSQYLTKGKPILVTGKLSVVQDGEKTYLNLKGCSVDFVIGGEKREGVTKTEPATDKAASDRGKIPF